MYDWDNLSKPLESVDFGSVILSTILIEHRHHAAFQILVRFVHSLELLRSFALLVLCDSVPQIVSCHPFFFVVASLHELDLTQPVAVLLFHDVARRLQSQPVFNVLRRRIEDFRSPVPQVRTHRLDSLPASKRKTV